MACATCIRGHRSTSCKHADRPLLKLRRKGRPISDCDLCYDTRKARRAHVRCLCELDESEAPKRKVRKSNKAGSEQSQSNCNCEDASVCTCTTAKRIARRLSSADVPSSPSPSVLIIQESRLAAPSINSELASKDCCLPGGQTSPTPDFHYAGASPGDVPSRKPCCIDPTIAPMNDAKATDARLGLLLYPRSNSRQSHLSFPSSSYGRPPVPSSLSRDISVNSMRTFDLNILSLWGHFPMDDATNEGDNGTINVLNPSQDFSVISACSCRPTSCCNASPSVGACCPQSPTTASGNVARCTSFDCSTLIAALAQIDGRFQVTDQNSLLAGTLSPQSAPASILNSTDQNAFQTFLALAISRDVLDKEMAIQSDSRPASAELIHSAPPASCTCNWSCTCSFCSAKSSDNPVSWEVSKFCVTCIFCFDETIADMQRAVPTRH